MAINAMSKLNSIEDRQIAELLSRKGLSVILMSSPWDGNGIILRGILEGLTTRYRAVNFCSADYEESPRLARLFNLLSPPGILFVKDGEMVQRITGPVSAGRIEELIAGS